MFKSVVRTAAAPSIGRALPRTRAARRFISTAPPHQQSRTWKSSATRWGLAGALVYYYNTASVFAEEPAYAVHAPPETQHERETYSTVDSISEQRRSQQQSQQSSQTYSSTVAAPDAESPAAGSPDALEEEASQQGAFNEETGEINWDCPCLGGMAYGPCGEQFRAAFSCFVFSKDEPKGVDCIDHFKAMQGCFREHPEMYGSELEDDEAPPQEGEEQGAVMARESADGTPSPEGGDSQAGFEARKAAEDGVAKSAESRGSQSKTSQQQAIDSAPSPQAAQPEKPVAPSEGVTVEHHVEAEKAEESLVPKSWHDGR